MCGIFGELVYNRQDLVDKNKFISLLDLSKNRGQDSQGYYSNNKNNYILIKSKNLTNYFYILVYL